jgi:hypothetical protein
MRLEVVKGFFTPAQCRELNDWAHKAVSFGWLGQGVDAGVRTSTRLTTRISPDAFSYPQNVLDAAKRVRKFCGVFDLPLVQGGRDGVVMSYTKHSGDVYEHKDPREDGDAVLRCNVMTSKPERGGKLFVEGRLVEIEEGDLHCYLASEHRHRVSIVLGDTPRILWMFGAAVKADDWNTGKIGSNLGIP